MTKTTDDTISIDISKATLDIHRLSDGKMMSFSNCPAGFKALSRFCAQTPVTRVVYEATGAYHSGLERALGAHLPLVKVNPLQARRFAQAQGVRAKTDAVDAKMLAVMGNAFVLKPDEPTTKIQHDLRELRAFRSGLIKDRTRIMSRLKTQTLSITCRQSKARLVHINKQIAEIDAEIDRLINSNDTLAQSMKIFRSIPGIGAICASTILIEMPEIGSMDRKQVACLTGLAPMTRQSGQWRGKSFIQGGRKVVRDALYMPALVAMRHNPDLKAKYQDMIKAGKPPKVALTALMRKLIELANALIKANRNWVKKRLDQDGYSESPGDEFFPDTIFGDYGVDTINGSENTLVTGGEGDCVLKVTRSFSSMIITDFVPGADVISYNEPFAGTSTDLPFSIHEMTGGSELLERVAVNRLHILRP